jgi:hypothetical protein
MTKGHQEIMTDRVVPLLTKLERAAIKIKKAISKRNGPIQDWIDGNIELSEALIEARHDFGDNDAAFDVWCRHNGFTKGVLGKHERRALIDMGANIPRMQDVLQKTERRSIELIYRQEWTLPNTRKRHEPLNNQEQPIRRPRKLSPKQPKIVHAAGAGKNYKEIAAEAPFGERAFRDVAEWGSLLVYSVLVYWLIRFIVYWVYVI